MDAIAQLEALKKTAAEICGDAAAGEGLYDGLPTALQAELFFLKQRCRMLGIELTKPAPTARMNVQQSRLDDDEEKWTSVGPNKQPVKIGKGQTKAAAVQGFIAEKEAEEKEVQNANRGSRHGAENVKEINRNVQSLINEGVLSKHIGIAGVPVPLNIEAVDEHAEERMAQRGITLEDAQSYIDNAMIMFNQSNGDRRLYISGDGNSVVVVEGKILKTAYSAANFDSGMRRLIREVGKYV